MKVIEGKAGKSIAIENILKENKDKRILMIDNVKIPVLYNREFENLYFMSYENNKEMWKNFIEDRYMDDFYKYIKENDFEMIIFETNDNASCLDNYKFIEDKIKVPLIVTIQNNDLNDLNIYNKK